MPQHVPGYDTRASPDGFDIIQVGRRLIPPVAARRFADPALVEADAPEPGQHRSRRGLHAVGHSGAAVQQQQRLAVIPALPYCKGSTGGVHDELIHPATLRTRPAATERAKRPVRQRYLLSGVRTGCADQHRVKTPIRRHGRQPADPRRLASFTLLVTQRLVLRRRHGAQSRLMVGMSTVSGAASTASRAIIRALTPVGRKLRR